jgi:hypothetical protein
VLVDSRFGFARQFHLSLYLLTAAWHLLESDIREGFTDRLTLGKGPSQTYEARIAQTSQIGAR